MTIPKKKVYLIFVVYLLIVLIANICGLIIPNLINSPGIRASFMDDWMLFLDEHKAIVSIEYLTYIIPVLACFFYAFTSSNEIIKKRIINLPIAYSTIGISGWIVYYLEEIFLLIVAKNMGYNIPIKRILLSTGMYITLEATITFTMSYFIMESIHKHYLYPKFFPEGNFSQMHGLKHPSVKLLFIVNYISVTFFPVAFLYVAFSSILERNDIPIDKSITILLLVIFVFGLIITISFKNSIQIPLSKLKNRIKKLNEGDYQSKVKILSNDDFGELGEIFNGMTESIEQKTTKIQEIQNSVLESMATIIESRDNSTGGHIKRTSQCVRVFVKHLREVEEYKNLSENFYDSIIKSAPLHDLGKIAIDDAILRKPGKFTDEEYEKMKSHSAEGAKIVSEVLHTVDDLEFKQIAVNVAHYHHEKWNGQGYPTKISGENIPIEARIMALADVFDALVSKRCYKDSFSFDKAFQIIEESSGSHFDPQLVTVFLNCRPELEAMYTENMS